MCCCSNSNKDMKDSAMQMASESMKLPAMDPICGMTVDPAKAASVEYEGTKTHFCCPRCATKFRANPLRYFKMKQDVLAKDEATAD